MHSNSSGAEPTPALYEYSDYYNNFDEFSQPCNNSSERAFGRVFLPTLYSLIFILGFIGNGLVVCVLVKHHNKTNLTDICLLNLAVSDLFFVLALPFISYSIVVEWIFGAFMCRLVSGLLVTGYYSSVFSMVVMTIDRYVVIMHAHTLARHRTIRVGIALTSVVWLVSLCVSLPTLVFTRLVNEDSVWKCDYLPDNRVWVEVRRLSSNIFGLLIPLLVMVICYTRMLPTLVAMKSAKKHNVIRLIVTVVAVFFLFWTPLNIMLFIFILKSWDMLKLDCHMNTRMNLSMQVTETIAFIHCCLNPIIYAFVGQKFMRRLLKLLGNWLPCLSSYISRKRFESSARKSSAMSRSSEDTIAM